MRMAKKKTETKEQPLKFYKDLHKHDEFYKDVVFRKVNVLK